MNWFKRIFLFLALNLLVITTVGLILNIFNVQPYISAYGLNYKSLLVFCFIWGMVGSLISLMLSRKMAKWMLRVKLVSKQDSLYLMVARLAKNANIPVPEVGIFHAKSPNAFATGPTRKRSLVAVSDALLDKMPPDQVEAVIGHELAHIKNGDMVTMTLLQGVVNAFVMFFARIAAFALNAALSRGSSRRSNHFGWTYYLTVMLFEVFFMALGSLIICAYSRFREYRADAGGAQFAGKGKMIAALQSLERMQIEEKEQKLAAFMIASPKKTSLLRQLYSTHPPLEKRIAKLQELRSYEFVAE
ncbi:MAG: protease HtpX [Candidatus Algichlamydia australiensis]|nr:protease HtpX [Chlamydiales bacterium]